MSTGNLNERHANAKSSDGSGAEPVATQHHAQDWAEDGAEHTLVVPEVLHRLISAAAGSDDAAANVEKASRAAVRGANPVADQDTILTDLRSRRDQLKKEEHALRSELRRAHRYEKVPTNKPVAGLNPAMKILHRIGIWVLVLGIGALGVTTAAAIAESDQFEIITETWPLGLIFVFAPVGGMFAIGTIWERLPSERAQNRFDILLSLALCASVALWGKYFPVVFQLDRGGSAFAGQTVAAVSGITLEDFYTLHIACEVLLGGLLKNAFMRAGMTGFEWKLIPGPERAALTLEVKQVIDRQQEITRKIAGLEGARSRFADVEDLFVQENLSALAAAEAAMKAARAAAETSIRSDLANQEKE